MAQIIPAEVAKFRICAGTDKSRTRLPTAKSANSCSHAHLRIKITARSKPPLDQDQWLKRERRALLQPRPAQTLRGIAGMSQETIGWARISGIF